jgi:predicted Rossmann-fold nucleotide-binding protein
VHAKPIIVVNIDGYFDSLDALVRGSIARGFARDMVLELYQMVDSVEDALARLKVALKL